MPTFAELKRSRLKRQQVERSKDADRFGGFWLWRQTMDDLQLWPGLSAKWAERALEEKQDE